MVNVLPDQVVLVLIFSVSFQIDHMPEGATAHQFESFIHSKSQIFAQ
jgi:hypothetical protein